MKESLHHCYRPRWHEIATSKFYYAEYQDYLRSHKYIKRNFKSNNRRAYYFFLSCYGRDFISAIRKSCKKVPGNQMREVERILRTKWIKLPED